MLRALLLLVTACVFAQQDPRGRIEGLITDSTGAVIARATVRATNTETGVSVSSVSNEQGIYEIPFLNPGPYRVNVEVEGFKGWNRSALELRTGDRLRVDVRLEVGSVAESVEVTAESPVLQSSTSTIGQVLTSKEASELPLRGGSLAWLYSLAPGVVQPGLPNGGPWNIDQASDASAAGAGRRSFDFNVDGVSNNSYGGRTAFVPPPEMVQEVKIDTTNYDASIGHSLGGSVNVSLKSGTNQLHGIWTGMVATGPMVARNFFTNRFIFDPATGPITDEKIRNFTPRDRWQRLSGAAGGPVFIPKLYNGKNRTFWMFGLQYHNRFQPLPQIISVPTAGQRQGDFSALLGLGAQYQLYDPFSTQPQGARFQRQPVPGNRIPSSRIDPVSRRIMNYWPQENTTGTREGLQNFAVTTTQVQLLKQPVVRLDHNFSEKHRMFARYSHSDFNGEFDDLVKGSNVRGRLRQRPHRGIALDNVSVLGPSATLDIRYGFTWFREFQGFKNQGWDLSEFGFPASLIAQLDPRAVTFPQISVQNMLQLGNNGGFVRTNYTHSLMGVLNWVRGNHSFKFGSDNRLALENNVDYGNVAPLMNFDPTFVRGPFDNSPNAPTGQGMASFLYGIPASGGFDVNDSRAERSPFYSVFVQDDWRIARTVTLNLGLRYEVEGPTVERFNRTTLDFDFTTPNPIEAQARAAYASAPIAEVPVASFRTIGGPTFAGVNGLPRQVRDSFYGALMPRIGIAWQLNPRTVIRSGFGIYFGLLGAAFTDVSQPGFNQRTNIVPTLDNGVTYVASISNPVPSGLEKPRGAADGLATFVGRSPGFFARDGRRPYTQRWSTSVQFEPMSRSVVELGYIGSRSVRLRVPTAFNAVPAQYLSTSPVRDQPRIDFLNAAVRSPFRGIAPFAGSPLFAAQNTTRLQLLRPYPHFGGLSESLPAGSSWYHAMTATFQRRFSGGLQMNMNYTWSKTMEAVEYVNEIDSIPAHIVSDLDRPHRFVASGVYELPFGKGKRFGGGANWLIDGAIGGWQVQAIYQWQSGPPLAFGNVIFTGSDYSQIKLGTPERNVDRWFNTSAFVTGALQPQNNIRTFPLRLPQARAAGLNLWDLGMFKTFRVGEWLKVQLRADAEAAMNTPQFDAPNMNPANSLFGRVVGTQGGERRVFAGLRLTF
ncbi:MAG: TonB-dependent receptor [Bryobacterales bacterium]|nr:TonB-dependent receptor [Bryobacterales bacterium]